MTTVDQDTIYQYQDGWELLKAAITEQAEKLRELERLAKTPQVSNSIEIIAGFPLISAQALLFELSMIGEQIDTLVGEINRYAERCGKPGVNVADPKRQ